MNATDTQPYGEPPTRVSSGHDLHQLVANPALIRQLPGLHREGLYLASGCPHCKEGERRFYCGPKFGYNYWKCRACGFSISTNALLGQAWAVAANPAVKPYAASTVTVPSDQVAAYRAEYTALAAFSAAQLPMYAHALAYLASGGISAPMAATAGLGYLDWPLYRKWFASRTEEQQRNALAAGLPDGARVRAGGFDAMFAAGHRGKIVFPYHDLAFTVVDIRTRSIGANDTSNNRPVRYTSPRGDNTRRGVNIPYGLPTLADARRIALTEGEKKSIVAGAGAVPVVALRGTSDMQTDYLEYFRHLILILAFDNDTKRQADGLTAGQSATIKHGRYLRAHGIAVMVLDPVRLGTAKGVDDYVNQFGIDAFNELTQPANLLTLQEFEAQFSDEQRARFTTPRADVGTQRQWLPAEHVDTFAHSHQAPITLHEAETQITDAVTDHFNNYKRGHAQLLITAPAGVGKTTLTIKAALDHAERHKKTVSVILPNHATINEKIDDGTLTGFRHIYGHNEDNCRQHEVVAAMQRYGYSPGALLCPGCPARDWCRKDGYKAQFVGQANRAFVHAHTFSNYPGEQDLIVFDELTHKNFVDEMDIYPGDIKNVLEKNTLGTAQTGLLQAFQQMFLTPNLGGLAGAEFYEVLQRFYPDLPNVDAWGDGSVVQGALVDIALAFATRERRSGYEAEELPQAFGEKLFAILADDMRRINAGGPPTGRVRMERSGSGRLVLTYSRGSLPGWYDKRPTIVLNATADAEIMQDLIGPVKVLAPVVAIAEGNQVVQDITRNNAKSTYAGNSPESIKRRDAWIDEIRQRIAAHPGGESDTVLITAKALHLDLTEAFPAARVAHYYALEGRNDLQAGLTILSTAPPVNLAAVSREACALYPGIDTTFARRTVAFAEQNAGGELLSVEQIDGVDPRLQRLIWQHRDAAVIQAVHRARLIRQTGRTVVILFSRPIPGLAPTQIIRDRATRATQRTAQTLNRLIEAGRALLADVGAFSVETIEMVTKCSVNTVRKYWLDVTAALDCNWFDLPVIQPLNNGGKRERFYRCAMPASMLEKHPLHVDHDRYNDHISVVIHVQSILPAGWIINLPAPPSRVPSGREALPAVTLSGRWAMVRNPVGFKETLLLARASAEPDQRYAYRVAVDYLNNRTDDQAAVNRALWTLGASYEIKWHERSETE